MTDDREEALLMAFDHCPEQRNDLEIHGIRTDEVGIDELDGRLAVVDVLKSRDSEVVGILTVENQNLIIRFKRKHSFKSVTSDVLEIDFFSL